MIRVKYIITFAPLDDLLQTNWIHWETNKKLNNIYVIGRVRSDHNGRRIRWMRLFSVKTFRSLSFLYKIKFRIPFRPFRSFAHLLNHLLTIVFRVIYLVGQLAYRQYDSQKLISKAFSISQTNVHRITTYRYITKYNISMVFTFEYGKNIHGHCQSIHFNSTHDSV